MHDSNAGDIASARLCWAEATAKRAPTILPLHRLIEHEARLKEARAII